MKYRFEIDSGNAALTDGMGEYEIARLLRETATKVEDGQTSGKLLDINGNTVGSWELTS